MNPVSSLPAIIALFVAVLTTYLITTWVGATPNKNSFASIDGLRGYLAFLVFLHHSSIWFFYLRSGQWKVPPSNLYTHFGQSSVALFFMITGFLFFSKIIDGKTRGLDWGKLFISRFMRLVPLYLFSMFLLFSIVAFLSNGILNESLPNLFKNAIYWLGFTIPGAPNLNGVDHTSIIVAGVTWSLPYEWLFYFSLPLLALTVRLKPPYLFLALGLTGVACISIWLPKFHHLLSFLGGISASFLVRVNVFREFAVKPIASYLIIFCIAILLITFPSARGILPIFLISLSFSLIASGNSLFGTLTHPISRTLGEIAYSIYLLHGIALFLLFTFVVGIDDAKNISPITHWLFIIAITPLLILISFFTFRLIERPAMQSTNLVTLWIRSRLTHG